MLKFLILASLLFGAVANANVEVEVGVEDGGYYEPAPDYTGIYANQCKSSVRSALKNQGYNSVKVSVAEAEGTYTLVYATYKVCYGYGYNQGCSGSSGYFTCSAGNYY